MNSFGLQWNNIHNLKFELLYGNRLFTYSVTSLWNALPSGTLLKTVKGASWILLTILYNLVKLDYYLYILYEVYTYNRVTVSWKSI